MSIGLASQFQSSLLAMALLAPICASARTEPVQVRSLQVLAAVEDGLWELRQSIELPGAGEASDPEQGCLSRAGIAADLQEFLSPDQSCRGSILTDRPERAELLIRCASAGSDIPPGRLEITAASAQAFSVALTVRQPGRPMLLMRQDFQRLGACTPSRE